MKTINMSSSDYHISMLTDLTVQTVVLREVLDNDYYRAEYYVTDDGTELVDVTFDEELNVRTIDVTADSLLALTRDVLKHF